MSDAAFRHGVLAGIAASMAAVHVWFAATLGAYRGMYRDMGSEALPFATRLVLSTAWLWSVPLVAAGVLAWLVVRRPRTIVPYAALVLALAATLGFTWYFATAPIREIAGNIRAE
jgi:hypothetical protein